MSNLSSKILSLVLPIVVSLAFVLVFLIIRKPLLTEVLVSLVVVSVAYFIFVFICLIFNIGIQKERPFDFAEIPGLTKHRDWFKNVASADGSPAVDIAAGADDPLLGCLVGALVAILLPLLTAIVVFLLSGGVEVLLFLAAYVCYYSVVRVLRMQLTSRKKAKGNFVMSLWYSAFHTLTTVGLLPIGLVIFMLLSGREIF